MQIRMFTDNCVNTAVGSARRMNQAVHTSTGVFDGAQCKVTISREGRKLSEQAKAQTARSAQSIKAEKILMRQQEQPEREEQLGEFKDQYLELLDKIKGIVKSTNNYHQSKEYMDATAKRQQVLSDISGQKQKQAEEKQENEKAAQQMAMQSFQTQDEIDSNNRDLFVMLKTLEEAEKAKEEKENKDGGATENGSSSVSTENSVSDVIANPAAQFTASSVKRELDVVGMIQALNDEGHYYIDRADEIKRNAFDEANHIREIFEDDNYTNDEKKNAVLRYGAKMAGADIDYESEIMEGEAFKELKILLDKNISDDQKEEALSAYRAKMRDNSDLSEYRQRGVQMIRDSKECKLKHIQANPLQYMEAIKDGMMQSAIDAAFKEASQGKLDETSQELADIIKDLIDERNDITNVEENEKEKEDNEEEKENGELLHIEEEEQVQERIFEAV